MKTNLTIEEAKKALQKEAKRVRAEENINGDNLKVTCNAKQMENKEFTIYSRHIETYREVMLEVGGKFGVFIKEENGRRFDGRLRFAFTGLEELEPAENSQTPTEAKEEAMESHGKDTVESAPVQFDQPKVVKPIMKCTIEGVNCAIATIREASGWTADQICLNVEKSNSRHFVIRLTNTDRHTEQMELTPLSVLGHVIEINRYAECTEYIFRLHTAPYERPQIKMDLRGLPYAEAQKEAKEEAKEVPQDANVVPLAEAKKDIMKFASALRKKHNIAGSDFRIICTDMHISIGEFILFTKGEQNNEHLRHEFDQFGRCYKIESAGGDATRFRFYYKGTNGYAQ